jgi:Family of unknown function (DUF5678)
MAVPLPDRVTLDAVKRRAEDERAFWSAHRAELTQRFPDEFIAVRNGEIVDHDPDLMILARRLQKKGIPSHKVSIFFTATQPESYLL